MRKAGKLSRGDLEVLERAARYEQLNSRELPTEEYVKLRRSGAYDKLEEDSSLSSTEMDRAEQTVRRVATWLFSESAQHGRMSAKDARAAIGEHVAVPDGADLDDETFLARASTLADQGAKLDKPKPVPSWGHPDPAITVDEERDFLMRQAGRVSNTPSMRRHREAAKEDPDHPFAVAERAREGLPEEEVSDA